MDIPAAGGFNAAGFDFQIFATLDFVHFSIANPKDAI